MACVTWFVSMPTVTCTGEPGAEPERFNVTPGIAPVMVLLALLYGIPSIDNTAFAPPAGALNVRLVLLPVIARADVLPVDWLIKASRDPFASVTTLAVTPQFRLLI